MRRNISRIWMRVSCLLFAFLLALPLNLLAGGVDQVYVISDSLPQEVITTGSGTKIYEIDNGDTLEEVAESIRRQDFESVVGFDAQGNKLFNYTSFIKSHATMTSTQFKTFLAQGGTLMVHNHPSGGGFSAADLRLFAKYQIPRTMVIGDTYTYIVEVGAEGWCEPSEIYDFYNARRAKYLTYVADFLQDYRVSVKAVLAAPDTPDDGSFAWFCLNEVKQSLLNDPDGEITICTGYWISHHALLDVAEEFDLTYQRVMTEDFDFTNPDLLLDVRPEVDDAG